MTTSLLLKKNLWLHNDFFFSHLVTDCTWLPRGCACNTFSLWETTGNCKTAAQVTWREATCLQTITVQLGLIAITLRQISNTLQSIWVRLSPWAQVLCGLELIARSILVISSWDSTHLFMSSVVNAQITKHIKLKDSVLRTIFLYKKEGCQATVLFCS